MIKKRLLWHLAVAFRESLTGAILGGVAGWLYVLLWYPPAFWHDFLSWLNVDPGQTIPPPQDLLAFIQMAAMNAAIGAALGGGVVFLITLWEARRDHRDPPRRT